MDQDREVSNVIDIASAAPAAIDSRSLVSGKGHGAQARRAQRPRNAKFKSTTRDNFTAAAGTMAAKNTDQKRSRSQSDAPRLLYDRKEAARQLSISVRSLDYQIAGKQIRTRRIGSKVMVTHGELVRFSRTDHPGPVNCTSQRVDNDAAA
jgi:hypothetical protein